MAAESVKISTTVVAKVRRQKKKSGINVGKFFEIAALEKLERETPYLLTRIIPAQATIEEMDAPLTKINKGGKK